MKSQLSSRVWVCPARAQLRIVPAHSGGSLTEAEDALLWLSPLGFFLYSPATRAAFPGSSGPEDGCEHPSFSSLHHLYGFLTGSLALRTELPGKQLGSTPPVVVSPSSGSTAICLRFFTFQKPRVVVLRVLTRGLHFNQRERDAIGCACHRAESGTCHLFF